MSDLLAVGPSASTTWPGYPASNICDDNEATYWNSANGQSTNQWWKYAFASEQVFNKVRIKPYGGGWGPKNVIVQGSNNDSDWDELDTALLANSSSWQELSFVNSTGYAYFRLWMTDAYGSSIAVYEMEVIYDAGSDLLPVGPSASSAASGFVASTKAVRPPG